MGAGAVSGGAGGLTGSTLVSHLVTSPVDMSRLSRRRTCKAAFLKTPPADYVKRAGESQCQSIRLAKKSVCLRRMRRNTNVSDDVAAHVMSDVGDVFRTKDLRWRRRNKGKKIKGKSLMCHVSPRKTHHPLAERHLQAPLSCRCTSLHPRAFRVLASICSYPGVLDFFFVPSVRGHPKCVVVASCGKPDRKIKNGNKT